VTRTKIAFEVDAWSHLDSETCISFQVITIWRDSTDGEEYLIDRFNGLLYQASSRKIDCVIGVEDFTANPLILRIDDLVLDATGLYFKQSIAMTLFDARGSACLDENFYSVFALNKNGL